jgi:SAM-dependent methyltransferase
MSNSTGQSNRLAWQEDRYREVLRTPRKGDLLESIWRDAYGDDYPEDADPFGFVTLVDLEALFAALRLDQSSTLLDIGCGRGGPGLWIARRAECSLIGIDIVAEAIDHANQLKMRFGLSDAARFVVGSFTATGLEVASVQAIVSIDAFWMVLDKTAAVQEMSRVLSPGGRFVMTTWVPPYLDLQSLLGDAGLRVVSRQESPRWKERQLAVYAGILRHRAELAAAIGEVAAALLVAEAQHAPAQLHLAPRCMIVAERSPEGGLTHSGHRRRQ